jgi:hypothetical protein
MPSRSCAPADRHELGAISGDASPTAHSIRAGGMFLPAPLMMIAMLPAGAVAH